MVIITMTLLAGCQAQFQTANAIEIQKPFVSSDKSIPGTLNADINHKTESGITAARQTIGRYHKASP